MTSETLQHASVCGVSGIGMTAAAATADAMHKLQELVRDVGLGPHMVGSMGHEAVVWRSVDGWACSTLPMFGRGHTNGSYATAHDADDAARAEIAKVAWSPEVENDVEFVKMAALTDARSKLLMDWIAYRRRYHRWLAVGVSPDDASEMAMLNIPLPADRARAIEDLISQVSRRLGRREFDRARGRLDRLIDIIGEHDPEVVRLRNAIAFVEGQD
jgi:hypothetical protein